VQGVGLLLLQRLPGGGVLLLRVRGLLSIGVPMWRGVALLVGVFLLVGVLWVLLLVGKSG
jgi:hypothetical protein